MTALLLLPFGGFIYLAGWLVGVALLWKSDRWTTMERWFGTLVLPFGYVPVLMLGSFVVRARPVTCRCARLRSTCCGKATLVARSS